MKTLILICLLLLAGVLSAQVATPMPTESPNVYKAANGMTYAISVGPRGGQYYKDSNGEIHYLSREPKAIPSTAIIQTGPRGGQYYLNEKGRKIYVKKK